MAIFKRTKKDDEKKDAEKAPKVKSVKSKESSVESKDAKKKPAAQKVVAKKSAAKKDEKPAAEKKAPAKKPAPKKVRKVTSTVVAHRVLRRPLITEKTANLAADGVYVFEIAIDSGKIEVRDAIRELYGVTPRRVNVMKVRGKRVRFGRRKGVRRASKKALVYLKKGEHIDVYEGV